MNKNFKLEFVVFNISHENAVFLWKMLTRMIEFLGFDVAGDVTNEDILGQAIENLDEAMKVEFPEILEDGFPK